MVTLQKARTDAAASIDHAGVFEQDGYRLDIQRWQAGNGQIEFFARAFYNDRQLGFGHDGRVDIERFVIGNPPLLLPVSDGPVILKRDRCFIESPAAALRSVLFDMARSGKRDADIKHGLVGNTTYTLFGTTGDGYVLSTDSTYATARSGSGLVATLDDDDITIGQLLNTGTYSCWEGFASWNTSGVAGTVSAATVSLFSVDSPSAQAFTFNARRLDYGTLTTADWIAGASLSGQTLLATFASSGLSANSYAQFTSDAAFLTNINQSGTTGIIFSSSRHEGNNAPSEGTNEKVGFSGAIHIGTTQDPRLVIVAAPLTSIPVLMNHYRQQGLA